MNQSIIVFAPAKINLFLHVVERLPSGFHKLQSIFGFLSVGDEIELCPAACDSFSIIGPFAAGLSTKDNSVIKAKEWFYKQFSYLRPVPLHFKLYKRLPVASGLGGGTMDAAATLLALLQFYKVQLTKEEKEGLVIGSGELGADVPVCLAYQLQLGNFFWLEGSGKTELPQAMKMPPLDLNVVIINPLKPVPTGPAFAAITQFTPPIPPVLSFVYQEDVIEFLKDQTNIFTPSAVQLVPEIKMILESFFTLEGCLLSRLSGSGASCFGLFTPDSGRVAIDKLRDMLPAYWIQVATLM